MRPILTAVAFAALCASSLSVQAAQKISGEYLESRTCDVWTGPCFANAEMGLAGKESVMAWKVDQGAWNDVALDGLGAALILKAEGTLGSNGIFPMNAGATKSAILVDDKANEKQRDALVAFVKDAAGELLGTLEEIRPVPITLANDHLEGRGVFKAGDLAEIQTRKLGKKECICTNEIIFYLPLTNVENYSPAYSLVNAYQGEALNSKWVNKNQRSAFLATFSR